MENFNASYDPANDAGSYEALKFSTEPPQKLTPFRLVQGTGGTSAIDTQASVRGQLTASTYEGLSRDVRANSHPEGLVPRIATSSLFQLQAVELAKLMETTRCLLDEGQRLGANLISINLSSESRV